MASLNRIHLIGRLTRDPEVRDFANGGKVAKFGFAVTGERKKQADGTWQDVPCFIDCEAFNSTHEKGRKLADLCAIYLAKGQLAYVEGHLILDSWQAADGTKRQAHRVRVDDVQFLTPRQDRDERQPERRRDEEPAPAKAPEDEDIPF